MVFLVLRANLFEANQRYNFLSSEFTVENREISKEQELLVSFGPSSTSGMMSEQYTRVRVKIAAREERRDVEEGKKIFSLPFTFHHPRGWRFPRALAYFARFTIPEVNEGTTCSLIV